MIVVQLVALPLGAVLIGFGARALARWPTAIPARPTRHAQLRSVPVGLEHKQRLIATAWNAGDVHLRLRPVLRQIASARLRRHGADLDGDDPRARALLGESLWEVVRPDRPRPEHGHERRLRRGELRELVDRLEDL
jgi:hypothetical protein